MHRKTWFLILLDKVNVGHALSRLKLVPNGEHNHNNVFGSGPNRLSYLLRIKWAERVIREM